MRVKVLRALLCAAALASFGCAAFMHTDGSRFFSRFSLEELVGKNEFRPGLVCSDAGGGGGGIGASAGGSGGGDYRRHKSEGYSCRMSSEKFDEAGFIAALRRSVEAEIKEGGAKVTGGGSPDAASFYFEYELGDGSGRVEITGAKTAGGYYSLSADLDERSKGASR